MELEGFDADKRLWARKIALESGCWLWTGSVDSWGYGTVRVGGSRGHTYKAHRIAWQVTHGPIPQGKRVMHRCDVTRCINPAHLLLGSDADNNDDKARKGRAPKKLTPDDVREIRRRQGLGESDTVIALDFGVQRATLWAIRVNHTHRHIK